MQYARPYWPEFSQGVLRAKDHLSPDERYLFNQIIGTHCGVIFCLSCVHTRLAEI